MWSVRLFSLILFVNFLSRTLSLSRRRKASVALECETQMIIERPPVKVVGTRRYAKQSTAPTNRDPLAADKNVASTTEGSASRGARNTRTRHDCA